METVETMPLISPEMVEQRTHDIMQALMVMRPSATWLDAHEQLFGLTSPYLEFLKTNPTVFIVRELLSTKVMIAAARYVSELHARNTLSTPVAQVVTVRMPAKLHNSLVYESHRLKTSLNKLCLAKLLMPLDPAAAAAAGRTRKYIEE